MNKNITADDLAFQMLHVARIAGNIRGDTWSKYMAVTLQPGDRIDEHAHKRHAVLYYPAASDALVIAPLAGTMVYLPPGTLHSVPVVTAERRSVAMLISE